tara:strand:- start:1022 stop:1966 length:945 start_codon:yes stop_codon:yes gene_type:complete
MDNEIMKNIEPKSILDLLHYKIAYKLYYFLSHKNHSNIIIHGEKNSGKSMLVNRVIKDIYPGKGVKYKGDDFSLYMYNNCYLFNCSFINNKNEFLDFIKNIIKTYDYYTGECKYIILDNFETISEHLQNTFKVIIENAYYTCKFIIITDKYNKVILPIRSRCISLRVPDPCPNDKFIYCKHLFMKNSIPYNEYHLFSDCKLLILPDIFYKYLFGNLIDYKDNLYQTFNEIINKPILNENDIINTRKLASKIKEMNIPIRYILNKFIDTLTEKDPYMKIIQVCSESNYKIVNSYRELIHIESLIIYLNLLINNKL